MIRLPSSHLDLWPEWSQTDNQQRCREQSYMQVACTHQGYGSGRSQEAPFCKQLIYLPCSLLYIYRCVPVQLTIHLPDISAVWLFTGIYTCVHTCILCRNNITINIVLQWQKYLHYYYLLLNCARIQCSIPCPLPTILLTILCLTYPPRLGWAGHALARAAVWLDSVERTIDQCVMN